MTKRYGKSTTQQRKSRREFLTTAGLATAGLVLANPALLSTASAASDVRIKRGGTHVRGDWLNVNTLDSHFTSGPHPAFLALYNHLFTCRMVDQKTLRHELKAELVETWEQPDPTTYILNLRKGVKFHDGSDWNAEVAKWNLERLLKHPKSSAKARLEALDNISVVDSDTIKLKLKHPSASMLSNLSGVGDSYMGMVSKAAVEKMGEKAFAANPVGTGPFRFDSWVRDDRINFVRFEDYWEMGEDGKSLPYLDKLVIRYAAAPQLMLMLRSGEIEATRFINLEDIPIARKDETLITDELMHAIRIEPHIGFNRKSGVLSENLKLRQAALHALDRKAMAGVLGFGAARPHYYAYWGPGSEGWDESIKKYEYDPQKAKQLVVEAGYPNGVDIRLISLNRPNHLRDAEVLKSMWDAVGLRTTVEPMERAAFNQKGKAGEGFDVMTHVPQVPETPDVISKYVACNGGTNRSGHCSKEFDRLMAEAATQYDASKRYAKYKQALTILQEEASFGTGFAYPATFVYKKYVKGYYLVWDNVDARAVWLDK